MAAGWSIGGRAIRLLIALVFAVYNLVPLYGLWAWGWDAFQLLILYWSETVVLAAWAMARIAFVPAALLGTALENGNTKDDPKDDPVGGIIAGVFGRIVLMQVAIICGAWVAARWGSLAPMAIIAAIKTLLDVGHRAAMPAGLQPAS